ncbi:MAG: glycerophosphodiester phosphodiesterase family protein [Saprospiraceae bacterium]
MKAIIYLIAMICSTTLFAQPTLVKQGHRGCRGYLPENTIMAMKKALDLGVQVLELDVVISKDNKVVVSHDPYFASAISLQPNGDTIAVEDEMKYNLYTMNYAEIRKYDVGSKHNQRFPKQQNSPCFKPLLSELIDAVEEYARSKGIRAPYYNIEIKSKVDWDDKFHPKPKEFVELVIDVCKTRSIMRRMNIQSFDIRPLKLLHWQYPSIALSYLTGNEKSISENLQSLGFTPNFYSPYYKTVDANMVNYCHENGMKIIPWTVNTRAEIDALILLKVDGIITDYPDLF